jgi:hypothetical protein
MYRKIVYVCSILYTLTYETVIGVFANEDTAFNCLNEYTLDDIFKDLDLVRDVRLDHVNKGEDAFHRSYEGDQLLVSKDLISNDLHSQ